MSLPSFFTWARVGTGDAPSAPISLRARKSSPPCCLSAPRATIEMGAAICLGSDPAAVSQAVPEWPCNSGFGETRQWNSAGTTVSITGNKC
jgi:hypothetical protein